MVRALASLQCGPGSNPGVNVICGLSLLLVLSPAPRGFSRVLRFFPLLKNQHFQISIRSGTLGHISMSSYELLSAPLVNKLQTNYNLKSTIYLWFKNLLKCFSGHFVDKIRKLRNNIANCPAQGSLTVTSSPSTSSPSEFQKVSAAAVRKIIEISPSK